MGAETIRDDRVSIFDRSVTVNTDASDSGDGVSYGPQSTFLTYDQPLYYALWAWGGVENHQRHVRIGLCGSLQGNF